MNEQQRRMSAAASAGMSAIIFVTDPVRWPAFAAFAEQQAPHTLTWGEADRLAMRDDAKLLWKLSEALEAS